jgi:hypothetical protein
LIPNDAILNRHAFETQQTILEYLPQKAKIRILIEHPNPTFINETRIEDIKITNPDPMIINES